MGLKQNRERLLLAQEALGLCWAQHRGTELRDTEQECCSCPWDPKEITNSEIQSLSTEINPRWTT